MKKVIVGSPETKSVVLSLLLRSSTIAHTLAVLCLVLSNSLKQISKGLLDGTR